MVGQKTRLLEGRQPASEKVASSFHTQGPRLPDVWVTVKLQEPVSFSSEPWQQSKHLVERKM